MKIEIITINHHTILHNYTRGIVIIIFKKGDSKNEKIYPKFFAYDDYDNYCCLHIQ